MIDKALLIKHYNEPNILYDSITYLEDFIDISVLHAADTPIHFIKSGEKSILTEIENLKIIPYQEINGECLAKLIEYELLRNSLHLHDMLKHNARLCLAYAHKCFTEDNIKYLIVWNGMPLLGICFVYMANKFNIKTIFCENGPLPNTIAVDSVGINYKCSLSSYHNDNLSVMLDNVTRKADWSHIKDNYVVKKDKKSGYSHDISKHLLYLAHCFKFYKKFPEICVTNIFSLALVKRINKLMYQRYITSLPKEQYIFFPFQVYDDTQILIYSKFKNMEEVVYFLIDQIKIYNRNKGCNLKLAIKQHPGDLGRKEYINLFRRLDKDFKDLAYIIDGSIESIITNALCTVTINSSVGFESLFFGTPVITLGQAFYNYKQLVEAWNEQIDFQCSLERVINNEFDRDLIKKYLIYIYDHLLVQRESKLVADKLITYFN